MKKLILLTFFMLSTINLASAIKCDINNYRDFIFNYPVTADLIEKTGNGCNLRGANLGGLNLAGAWLVKTDLTNANMERANLTGAIISGSNLTRVKAYQINLAEATIESSNLKDAYLRQANFVGAEIRDSNFDGADLGYASLNGRSLFEGSNLIKANLEGMTGWNHNNFRDNSYSNNTVFPQGFVPKKSAGMIRHKCWLFFPCSIYR